jgi:hypothetical protein
MVVSGSYVAAIEDSEEPDLFLQFTGFSSAHEAGCFLEWLDKVLQDPFSGINEDIKH